MRTFSKIVQPILPNSKQITKLISVSAARQLLDYSMKSRYQIPSAVLNTFHMVNATIWDNVLYNFHVGVQIVHKQLIDRINELESSIATADKSGDKSDVEYGKLSQNIIESNTTTVQQQPPFGSSLSKTSGLFESVAEVKTNRYVQTIINCLGSCSNLLEFNFPLHRDNGDVQMVKAYRVRHSSYKSPCLGGVRMAEKVDLADLKGLAFLLTMKHAILRIPFGGAFGAILLNPKAYSPKELQLAVTSYATECAKHGTLSPLSDVHYPDINIGSREIDWMVDGLNNDLDIENANPTAALVGKSVCNNGMENYYNSAALSAYLALNNVFSDIEKMSALNLTSDWKKNFVIHGFGKVGQSIAKKFIEAGALCIGIQEANDVALFNNEGIDVNKLIEFVEEKGTISGYPGGQDYQSNLIGFCADVLVLTSLPKVVNCFSVREVTAKIVLEVAYGAITPTACRTLLAKNILVIPDIYAGVGSEIGAYMEYVKNINNMKIGKTGWDDYGITSEDQQTVLHQSSSTNSVEPKFGELDENSPMTSQACSIPDESNSTEGQALEKVIKRTMERFGQEVDETMAKHNLGIDIRTACYANAVQGIFKEIHDSKKYCACKLN